MPFTHVDDKPAARFLDPEVSERRLSQARHPSSRGRTRIADISTAYKPLIAPLDASWPRATVRPLPRLDGQGSTWAAKLWAAQGVPRLERGRLVARGFANLDEAMDWAASEVEHRRAGTATETPC